MTKDKETKKNKLNTTPGTGLTRVGWQACYIAMGPSENVEWHAENQILGFIYYDTTNKVIRSFTDSGWVTVSTD